MRSIILCFLAVHTTVAFNLELFKPRPHSTTSILDIIKKPKIPVVNIQLGSGLGAGASFGFGFGFGGQFLPSGTGVNLPPVKPVIPEVKWEEENKKKVGPRPNWGEDKEDYPKPDSYEEDKEDYSNPESFEKNEEQPKLEEKGESLPDWEDIGEKHSKSENMMDEDLVGDGIIQPRLNRRNKRFIESRVFHVPLLFRSNAKPYNVKIRSNPNSLLKESQNT